MSSTVPARRPASITEHKFETTIAWYLRRQGLLNYHTTDRYIGGIPDRYIAGGNWLEFKRVVLPRVKNPLRGRCALMHGLSQRQMSFLNKWHKAGDKTWLAILVQSENFHQFPTRCIIEPYIWCLANLRQINRGTVAKMGVPYKDRKQLAEYIDFRFNTEFERNCNEEYYQQQIDNANKTLTDPKNRIQRHSARVARTSSKSYNPLEHSPRRNRERQLLDVDWSEE